MKFKLFLILVFFQISLSALSQTKINSFEGIIQFKKVTLSDTFYYNYYIKGSNVKIEHYSKPGNIINYKIIDFNKGEVKIVNSKIEQNQRY